MVKGCAEMSHCKGGTFVLSYFLRKANPFPSLRSPPPRRSPHVFLGGGTTLRRKLNACNCYPALNHPRHNRHRSLPRPMGLGANRNRYPTAHHAAHLASHHFANSLLPRNTFTLLRYKVLTMSWSLLSVFTTVFIGTVVIGLVTAPYWVYRELEQDRTKFRLALDKFKRESRNNESS